MSIITECLKIPNLGILLYFLIFIIIIPYILYSSNNQQIVKYYIPILIIIAHLLSILGNKNIFKKLYQEKPTDIISKISTYTISVIAILGIIWQISLFSNKIIGIMYGIILALIVFIISRNGLNYAINYVKENTDLKYKYDIHLIITGLLCILVLLGLQYILVICVEKISGSSIDEDNTTRFLKNFDLSNINSFNDRLR
jgi:hypothetical protein